MPDVNVWHRTLSTRSFVLSPSDDLELWIKFANLSRKNGRLALSENTLNMLLQDVKSKEGSVSILKIML
jgi:FKBP12-rapamycin complex-associated protein